MLASSRRRIAKLLEQVRKMEEECENIGDEAEVADRRRCQEACKTAREHLLKSGPVLQLLLLQGPQGVIYETDGDLVGASGSICPQATGIVQEAQRLVNQALEVSETVLVIRHRFRQALAEMQQKQNDAKAILDGLQAGMARFHAEGFDVVEAVQSALLQDAEVQAILREAKDADAYAAAVQAFVDRVAYAELAFEEGQEELERRKRERHERMRLVDELERGCTQMREKLHGLRKAHERHPGGFQSVGKLLTRHKELLCDLQTLQVSGKRGLDKLSDFKDRVTVVLGKKAEVGDAIDEIIAQAEGKSKSKFSDLQAAWKRKSGE